MDRREDIVTRAAVFLERAGYHGFSYADLASQVGVAKASIHHHFPHKEDLALAVIARAREFVQRQKALVESMADRSAWERLRAFFEQGCTNACSGRVCVLTSLLSDYSDLPPVVQAELRLACDSEVAAVADLLREGRAKGELAFVGEAEARAAVVLALVKGSMFYARVFGSGVVEQNMLFLKRSLTGGA